MDASGVVEKELGGVTVLFGGLAAPLLYVSSTQINAVVPYGVDGQESAEMEVRSNGAAVMTERVLLKGAAPAIFLPIFNQDYSPNSSANPAEAGSVVVLFGTGEGET